MKTEQPTKHDSTIYRGSRPATQSKTDLDRPFSSVNLNNDEDNNIDFRESDTEIVDETPVSKDDSSLLGKIGRALMQTFEDMTLKELMSMAELKKLRWLMTKKFFRNLFSRRRRS